MESAAEVILTLEGASEFTRLDWGLLCQCCFHLEDLQGTQWQWKLCMSSGRLEARLFRADDGLEEVEVDYEFGVFDSEGERWGRAHRKKKAFQTGSASGWTVLAGRPELEDPTNRLSVQNCLRMTVRLWPVPRPLTVLARCRPGMRRTVACSAFLFSAGERWECAVWKATKGDLSDLRVVLHVDGGSVCASFRSRCGYSVMLESVSVVRSDGTEEVAWEGTAILRCNADDPPSRVPFIDCEKLASERSSYLPNGRLTAYVSFTDYNILSESHVDRVVYGAASENLRMSETGPNDRDLASPLARDFSALLDAGALSDFELRVGRETVAVHRAVLHARSPVFAAMLASSMLESGNNECRVPDFRADTVRHLVRFMYTDAMPDLDFEDAADLFSAADKYGVLSLRERCSRVLVRGLCLENVCHVLCLADSHQDAGLKERVVSYIKKDRSSVFDSTEWAELERSRPDLVLEVMQQLDS